MSDFFILRIHKRTKGFGETAAQEQNMLHHILFNAGHRIGSGHAPIPITDRDGVEVATYEFGEDALSHPDKHSYPIPRK